MSETFNALVLRETDNKVAAKIESLTDADLPHYADGAGEVTVRIAYSTLNYKDAMVLKNLGRIVRAFPHVPGIDFSGIVESSTAPHVKVGDRVVLNGWRVGEIHWGGYAQKARVRAEWLVALPEPIGLAQSMAIGTAGYTAMLAILALEEHGLSPDSDGEVLVTGAAGGVGSIAVALLSKLGYRVAASTGRIEQHEYLKALGAASIVPRAELEAKQSGPLASERWSAAIDNVGGPILSNLLAALKRWGSCASVGLAATPKLETSVVPFLLRGVNLLGIDSSMTPLPRRVQAWDRLAHDLDLALLARITTSVGLSEIVPYADQILAGQVRGRIVIDVNK